MRMLTVFLLVGSQAEPPDRTIRVQVVAQDAAAYYQAQVLGDLDRPVGEGIEFGGTFHPCRVDEKGNLEIDLKEQGKFRDISRRQILPFALKLEGDGSKGLTAKLEIRKREDGAWVYRNLTELRLQIGAEQFVVVDADGNGFYNEPGVDGMALQGQTWLFPLPAPEERWCSATTDFTAFRLGRWGENAVVKARPLATTVAAALPVLKGVLEERARIGLTPRPEDPKLSSDLQKHCAYMAQNRTLTHPETPGRPGYTKEGHEAGLRSILSMGTPADRIAHMMVSTYFHRQDVIRPHTLGFGVGTDGEYGGIDGRTRMGKEPAAPWTVLCPVPGQTGVDTTYAKESPDATPGDNAAGFPVTAYFHTDRLKLVSHSLKIVGAPGPSIDCYVYDPQTGPSSDFTRFQKCVCIIAKDPLKPNAEYEVALEVDVDGKPWKKTWRFSTSQGRGGRP